MHLYFRLSPLTIMLQKLVSSLALPRFHQKQKPQASPLRRVASYTIMSTFVDLMV